MQTGRHIGARFSGRIAELRSRFVRMRYFRGHGVQSPYVYDLVRQVFMRHGLLPGDRELCRALLAAGVAEPWAVELQNLAIHCRCGSFGLNRADADLCVATCALAPELLLALVRAASEARHTVVVLTPYADRERLELCRRIVAEHRSTSVDKRGYLLLFNNHLPKQHFRI